MALKESAIWEHGSSLWWSRLDLWKSRLDPLESRFDPFCADKKKISNKARVEESQKNIPSRIDLYKRRLDPCLSITAFSRFSKHVYMDNCTKTQFLWVKIHLKLKVAIFLWIVKGLESVFRPKRVFLSKY